MRNLFWGALALVLVLVVLPGAVGADSSGMVNISGSVTSFIDVTVTPGNLTFGIMTPGNVYENSTILEVSSSETWVVDAYDQNSGDGTGHMLSDTISLSDPITLSTDVSGLETWLPYEHMLSNTPGYYSHEITFRQYVTYGDSSGDYTITIVFTGYGG